jgi:hypothetical protein
LSLFIIFLKKLIKTPTNKPIKKLINKPIKKQKK